MTHYSCITDCNTCTGYATHGCVIPDFAKAFVACRAGHWLLHHASNLYTYSSSKVRDANGGWYTPPSDRERRSMFWWRHLHIMVCRIVEAKLIMFSPFTKQEYKVHIKVGEGGACVRLLKRTLMSGLFETSVFIMLSISYYSYCSTSISQSIDKYTWTAHTFPSVRR